MCVLARKRGSDVGCAQGRQVFEIVAEAKVSSEVVTVNLQYLKKHCSYLIRKKFVCLEECYSQHSAPPELQNVDKYIYSVPFYWASTVCYVHSVEKTNAPGCTRETQLRLEPVQSWYRQLHRLKLKSVSIE